MHTMHIVKAVFCKAIFLYRIKLLKSLLKTMLKMLKLRLIFLYKLIFVKKESFISIISTLF